MPLQVILDLEGTASETTLHGLTGHNEWVALIPTGVTKELKMEVSVTDAGFYPIVVELLRVG